MKRQIFLLTLMSVFEPGLNIVCVYCRYGFTEYEEDIPDKYNTEKCIDRLLDYMYNSPDGVSCVVQVDPARPGQIVRAPLTSKGESEVKMLRHEQYLLCHQDGCNSGFPAAFKRSSSTASNTHLLQHFSFVVLAINYAFI